MAQKNRFLARYLPFLLMIPVFFAGLLPLDGSGVGFSLLAALLLAAAFFGAMLPLKSLAARERLAILIISALAMLLRILRFEVETSDFTDFLLPWTERLRQLGGLKGLGQEIGNYNTPYMVLLALFSYLKTPVLYLVKLTSCLFDILLAVIVGLLVYQVKQSRFWEGAAFLLTLCLPTVLLNGAVWGQCDSIYISLSLLGLLLCLRKHPLAGMVSLAFGFAFKLQAIFLIPVFLPVLMAGKLKWRQLPVFPAAYLLAVSPSILAGRSFRDVLLFYVDSASTAGSALNYNSPSMYSLYYFYWLEKTEGAEKAGILAAALACLILVLLFFRFRRHITDRSLLYGALLITCLLPMLLPHMHERYFFFVDVLTVAAACVCPILFPTVLLSQFASLLGYHAYFYMRYLLPMRLGFAGLVVTVIAVAVLLVRELCGTKKPPQLPSA